MLKFSKRLPALRFHWATLSRFQFVKQLADFKHTHSGDNQMDSESNNSMEIDAERPDKVAGKVSPPVSQRSDGESGKYSSAGFSILISAHFHRQRRRAGAAMALALFAH